MEYQLIRHTLWDAGVPMADDDLEQLHIAINFPEWVRQRTGIYPVFFLEFISVADRPHWEARYVDLSHPFDSFRARTKTADTSEIGRAIAQATEQLLQHLGRLDLSQYPTTPDY